MRCSKCKSSSQVWRTREDGKLRCHRAGCGHEIKLSRHKKRRLFQFMSDYFGDAGNMSLLGDSAIMSIWHMLKRSENETTRKS